MKPQRIVLAGGSGFLGQLLSEHFRNHGREVIVLTRSPKAAAAGSIRQCEWDGRTLGKWSSQLDGSEVLINLSGRSVDCRYHARNRRLIMDSRVESTRVLGQAVSRCQHPPRVWLNFSTATIYKHTFGPAWNESGETGSTPEAKDEFSIEVAKEWEREFNAAQTPKTRKVALRAAMVLGRGTNSVFPMLCRLARLGLGGAMASGRQYVSWIHAVDLCRAVDWIIQHEEVTGPVNLAASHPLTNREMMAIVRELCGAPFGLPATAAMLELGAFFLRTETELIIKSRRVVPARLLAGGFHFRFPLMRDAMANLINPTCSPID